MSGKKTKQAMKVIRDRLVRDYSLKMEDKAILAKAGEYNKRLFKEMRYGVRLVGCWTSDLVAVAVREMKLDRSLMQVSETTVRKALRTLIEEDGEIFGEYTDLIWHISKEVQDDILQHEIDEKVRLEDEARRRKCFFVNAQRIEVSLGRILKGSDRVQFVPDRKNPGAGWFYIRDEWHAREIADALEAKLR